MAREETKPCPHEAYGERIAALAALLPDDRPSLLAEAALTVTAFDDACCAGDKEGSRGVRELQDAIVWKLNGGTFFGSKVAPDGGWGVFEEHNRARPGTVPLWGQSGEWAVNVEGMRVRAKKSGGDLSLNVVDYDKHFLSPTGFRSALNSLQNRTGTVQAATVEVIREVMREQGRPVPVAPGSAALDEPLPDWISAEESSVAVFEDRGGQMAFAF